MEKGHPNDAGTWTVARGSGSKGIRIGETPAWQNVAKRRSEMSKSGAGIGETPK